MVQASEIQANEIRTNEIQTNEIQTKILATHVSSMISGIAQVALSVRDIAGATAFYRDTLGLAHLFDAPGMSFFDVGGVRLMLSAQGGEPGNRATLVYLKVEDLVAAHARLAARGVRIEQPPHIVGRSPTGEVWLAFCADPDGNLLGLMSEKPLPA